MRLDLPRFKQEEPWTCLPACIRIVFAYWELELSERAIAEACGSSPLGTTFDQAAAGIESAGFEALVTGDQGLDWLLEQLVCEQPVIVSQRFPTGRSPVRHAVVVEGMDDHSVFYIDPASGGPEALPHDEFLGRWHLAGGSALVVYRP
jgi:ABC-type bacteriocin/lantibiotic exporter with double-glycine peptidase domain